MLSILHDQLGVWFQTKSGTNADGLTRAQRRWRVELRSAVLRCLVLLILILNLWLGEQSGNAAVHSNVITGYAIATILALTLALTNRAPVWAGNAFIVVDAIVVVALFHEHLFGGSLDHNVTNASLAIAFLLLNHVALRLVPRLVLLFATLVVTGWLSLLFVMMFRHSGGHSPWPLLKDAALAMSFSFAAFVSFLLTRDHNRLLKQAAKSERRRQNLSRFFSPAVVTEIQRGRASLDLQRRPAAMMFVDLRSFTRFAETAKPSELEGLLAEYRLQVTQAVFEHSGIIDKFIGDGVMAVFGPPVPRPDDVSRALQCALELSRKLDDWRQLRQRQGKPALYFGIGLHVGPVISGVLKSGQHDEFTVFGDAVNVAERLERLAKSLGASLVVSSAVLDAIGPVAETHPWRRQLDAKLEGRSGTLSIAYLAAAHQHKTTARHPVCHENL